MKIKVEDLKEPKTVTITGQEDWLERIYSYFPPPAGEISPTLSGEVVLSPLGYGQVRLAGFLKYEPFVECSRCGEPIRWTVDRNFDVIFRNPPDDLPRERELSIKDMDEYYVEKGELDVEGFLNEEIQLGIPSQTILKDEQGSGCANCRQMSDKEIVFEAKGKTEVKENPFAVLKNLKLNS